MLGHTTTRTTTSLQRNRNILLTYEGTEYKKIFTNSKKDFLLNLWPEFFIPKGEMSS